MRHLWRSLEDDREVSSAYAHRYPDAVYDAADPEWWDILYVDDDDLTDAELDALDAGTLEMLEDFDDAVDAFDEPSDAVDESSDADDELDEYDWGPDDEYDDDGYYEVEIGIDYGDDA